jgi:tetratricopeptide (TPR) repeat protein
MHQLLPNRWTVGLIAVTLWVVPALPQTHTTVRHYPVAESSASSVKAEVTQAEDALDHKDYASAEALLKKVTAADAKDYRAWFDLGLLYNATNRREQAIEAYRNSVAADGSFFESNFNLGISLAAAEQSAEAAKYLRASTTLKPLSDPERSLVRAWTALGEVLAQSKDAQGALAAFGEAEKLTPRDAALHISAGRVLESSGALDQAGEEFGKAAELDPKSKEALAGVANVNMRAHRLPEAEAALRKVVSVDPTNANAHLQLGRVLAAEDHNDEAATEIETALKLQPNDLDAERELAGLHAAAKQYDKAAAEYSELLQREPNNVDLHFAYGTVLMEKHDFPAAEQQLLAAAKINPSADVLGNLAVVASENKHYPLVLQALDARAKLTHENAGTYYLRATTFDHLQQATQNPEYLKQAIANYKQFLAASDGHNPDNEWKARHRLIALEPKK